MFSEKKFHVLILSLVIKVKGEHQAIIPNYFPNYMVS